MTWPQYFDHGLTGPMAKLFGVQAIPHTFTINADGVLQDEHIGDASIEGKLKRLVRRPPPLTRLATPCRHGDRGGYQEFPKTSILAYLISTQYRSM